MPNPTPAEIAEAKEFYALKAAIPQDQRSLAEESGVIILAALYAAEARATRAEARCKALENCGMFLRCALDGALSAMRLPLTECGEIAAWDALINTKQE